MRSLVFTEDLIQKFRTCVCTNVSSEPKATLDLSKDSFLVSAEPTEEYIKALESGKAFWNRQSKNLRPVFFVYECDGVPVNEQLDLYKKTLGSQYSKSIFSITQSGGKSVHMLVYIKPEDRDAVKHDFHYYWVKVAKMLFGNDTAKLDSACASIGRLTRLPGGTRDNGIRQICSYMNEEPEGIPLTECIKVHERELLVASMVRALKNKKYQDDQEELTPEQEITKMHNMRKKNSSSAFELACQVVLDKNLPSGENYIGAFKSLRSRGFSEEFIKTYYFDVVTDCHKSNMPRSFEAYWEASAE